MDFRWVALIALWTFLSGPIFGAPRSAQPSGKSGVAASQPGKGPAVGVRR
jgi:hypothetical protein